MEKNMITSVFNIESEAYQALSSFRRNPVSADYTIKNALIVKKHGETMNVLDGFQTSVYAKAQSTGWFIGMMLGIFSGFLGMLLFGSIGALIGVFFDNKALKQQNSLISAAVKDLPEDQTVLMILADETNTEAIAEKLTQFNTVTAHVSAEELLKKAEQKTVEQY